MLSKQYFIQRDQIEMISLDQLVPANHLVRKIESALHFSFMYELVEDMYSEVGRPSIDPVILIILAFIQYTFGIRSMRKRSKKLIRIWLIADKRIKIRILIFALSLIR